MKFTKIITIFIATATIFLGAGEVSAIYFSNTHVWPGGVGTFKLTVSTNKNIYTPGETVVMTTTIEATSQYQNSLFDTLFETKLNGAQYQTLRGRAIIGGSTVYGNTTNRANGANGSIVTGTLNFTAPMTEGNYTFETGTYILQNNYQYISWNNISGPIVVSSAPQPNRPPSMPVIVCSPEVIVNTPFDCSATATDPDGDTIRYAYDWNNDNLVDEYAPTSGYTPSGTKESLSHMYNSVGFKSMQIRAEDSRGAKSFWSFASVNVLARTNSCTLPWGGTIGNFAWVYAYQTPSVDYPASCSLEFRMCINGVLDGSYTNQNCVVNVDASCALPWGGSVANGNSTLAYQSPSVVSPASCVSQSRLCTNGTLAGTYTNKNCTVTAQVSGCNNNGVCNVGETLLNCPKDCKVKYKQF